MTGAIGPSQLRRFHKLWSTHDWTIQLAILFFPSFPLYIWKTWLFTTARTSAASGTNSMTPFLIMIFPGGLTMACRSCSPCILIASSRCASRNKYGVYNGRKTEVYTEILEWDIFYVYVHTCPCIQVYVVFTLKLSTQPESSSSHFAHLTYTMYPLFSRRTPLNVSFCPTADHAVFDICKTCRSVAVQDWTRCDPVLLGVRSHYVTI